MEQIIRTCDKTSPKGGRCGKEALHTEFQVDGSSYEVDLCESHQEAFRTALMPYMESARTVGKKRVNHRAQMKATGYTTADVREWAIASGKQVSPTGRLSEVLIREYEESRRK